MERMFDNCNSLISLDLSNIKIENKIAKYRMFEGCNSLIYKNINNILKNLK